MTDAGIREILDLTEGDSPTPEFVDTLWSRLEAEMATWSDFEGSTSAEAAVDALSIDDNRRSGRRTGNGLGGVGGRRGGRGHRSLPTQQHRRRQRPHGHRRSAGSRRGRSRCRR